MATGRGGGVLGGVWQQFIVLHQQKVEGCWLFFCGVEEGMFSVVVFYSQVNYAGGSERNRKKERERICWCVCVCVYSKDCILCVFVCVFVKICIQFVHWLQGCFKHTDSSSYLYTLLSYTKLTRSFLRERVGG